jgi:hypothetical protein
MNSSRDRQSISSTALLRGQSARTPPSTFLFLPIQLSNSRSIGEDFRPQKTGPELPNLSVGWLDARETLENQMAFRPPKASSPSVALIYGGASGLSNTFSKNIHNDAAPTRPCGKLSLAGARSAGADRPTSATVCPDLSGVPHCLAQRQLTWKPRRLVSHPGVGPAMAALFQRSADGAATYWPPKPR